MTRRTTGTTMDALTLLAAAAVAFLGSVLLPTVSKVTSLLAGGGPSGPARGVLLFLVVMLLAGSGLLLVGLALNELFQFVQPGAFRLARARRDQGDHPAPGDSRRT